MPDELTNNAADAAANDATDEVRPLGIPKPIPRGGSTTASPEEEPLSEDTIQIKRSALKNDPAASTKTTASETTKRRLKIFCYNCGQKLDLTDMTPFSKIDCPSCSSTIIVPRWFDNYLLEELCGVGGMAVVYRGLDLALDREVAIKILNKESAANEGKNKLFLHEARTVATLNHFAILPIYTCGEFEGQAYFVMQYMSGGSLDTEIEKARGKGLPVDEACKWLKDIAEGLDNAKRHGIIHHDIKPGNFMLDGERNVKIGDFGISQALHAENSDEISEIAASWGSPQYVSPEKASSGTESHLGDIYSLGATFYHILAGVPPFDMDDPKELLKAKTLRDPLRVSKHNPDIPEPLCDLIMSMMNRVPEARPGYRDIIAELNSIKKKSPKKGAKPAGKPIAGAPVKRKTKLVPKTGGAKVAYRPKKRGGSAGSAVQIFLLVAFLAFGYYAWNEGYLADYIPGAPSPKSEAYDYLPDVTAALAEGKTKRAMIQASEILHSLDETLNAKKQAALQLAFATYLSKAANPRSKCRGVIETLKDDGLEIDAPELAVLFYLSKPTYTAQRLRDTLKHRNALALAGEIAIFLRNVYDPKSPDRTAEIRKAYKRYGILAPACPDDAWEKCFEERLDEWYSWLFMRLGNASSLERLIASADLTAGGGGAVSAASREQRAAVLVPRTLRDLTPRALRASRSFASGRPRPASFEFSSRRMDSYLKSLPSRLAAKERLRAEQVTPLKSHLCAMMFHMPYSGERIKLRDGRVLRGKMMANPKYISIKVSPSKRVRVQWSELAPSQFAEILAFFAKTRTDMGKKKDGALDYMRAALFCDWYERYDDAVRYAKLAVATDPSITARVSNLMSR